MKRQLIRKRITFISFFLFPATFYYFSPYIIVDASIKGIINGSFLMFILLFLSSLIFGRAFCSWACPLGGAQEILSPLKKKISVKGGYIKWLIWVPWMISIISVAITQGGYKEVDPLFRTTYGFSLGSAYAIIAYTAVLSVLMITYFTVGKRSYCRSVCWIAPFMIIGRKIQNLLNTPSLKLVKTDNNCIDCKRCTNNCTMGLDIANMVKNNKLENSECILCGNCSDVCSKKCIDLKIK